MTLHVGMCTLGNKLVGKASLWLVTDLWQYSPSHTFSTEKSHSHRESGETAQVFINTHSTYSISTYIHVFRTVTHAVHACTCSIYMHVHCMYVHTYTVHTYTVHVNASV